MATVARDCISRSSETLLRLIACGAGRCSSIGRNQRAMARPARLVSDRISLSSLTGSAAGLFPPSLHVENPMNHILPRRSTILVMHHDPLLCAGLVAALRQHAAFEIFVGDIDAVRSDEIRIDVVIADYGHAMHLTDAAVRAMHRPLATARILALTSNDREADVRRAIEAGIYGYVLRGCSPSELIEGVGTVAAGMRYLCQQVAQRMADSLARASLTSRETEVLQLVMIGESNKAIARRLQIGLGTVKSHMGAIMNKLGATSRTHAVGIATTRGLVQERVPAHPASPASRPDLIALPTQVA